MSGLRLRPARHAGPVPGMRYNRTDPTLRMKRRLLNLLTALSLLLCVAVVALWVRSYWRYYAWEWETRTGRACVDSFRGYLSAGRVDVQPASMTGIPRGYLVYSEPAARVEATVPKPNWSFGVIRGRWFDQPGGVTMMDVRVPHWLVALAAGVAPGIYWYRRRPRTPPGCCPNCGYDLRATPGKCPECGVESTAPLESITRQQSGCARR